MDKLAPAKVDPEELPDGFTSADPNAPSAAAASSEAQQGKEEQKQAILQQALTPDALARLRRIKIVKPEKAAKLENQVVSMAVQGHGVINEGKLVEMLSRAQSDGPMNSKISIQRKKYAFDSDEDDNDDDLM